MKGYDDWGVRPRTATLLGKVPLARPLKKYTLYCDSMTRCMKTGAVPVFLIVVSSAGSAETQQALIDKCRRDKHS